MLAERYNFTTWHGSGLQRKRRGCSWFEAWRRLSSPANARGSASAPVEVEGAYMPVPKGVLSTENIPSSDANRFYHCTFIPLNFSLSSILKGNIHRHTKFCISDSASLFSGCANSPPSFVFFIWKVEYNSNPCLPVCKLGWSHGCKIMTVRSGMCMRAKSLQSDLTLWTQWTGAQQAPLSIGFAGQEHWSGLPGHPTQEWNPHLLNRQVGSSPLPCWLSW